jgi:hypothetical protein
MNNDEKREAALKLCIAPVRYTSDPDVINSIEETAKVQAEWDIYFAAIKAIYETYPPSTNKIDVGPMD